MNTEESTFTNNRQWARYAVNPEPALIRVGQREFQGQIVDESIGGLGISVCGCVPFSSGENLVVAYREMEAEGQAAAVKQISGGSLVSVRWNRIDPDKDDALERVFVKFQSMSVVCREITDQDTKSLVTLWNGKQFLVETKSLISISKAQRIKELKSTDGLATTLGQLYELECAIDDPGLPTKVMEFEFGFA